MNHLKRLSAWPQDAGRLDPLPVELSLAATTPEVYGAE